jgi:hypothetical protein
MVKVVALGAIAEMVHPFVRVVFYGTVKQVACFFYLVTNFGKVNKTKGSTMFFNEMFQRDSMES